VKYSFQTPAKIIQVFQHDKGQIDQKNKSVKNPFCSKVMVSLSGIYLWGANWHSHCLGGLKDSRS